MGVNFDLPSCVVKQPVNSVGNTSAVNNAIVNALIGYPSDTDENYTTSANDSQSNRVLSVSALVFTPMLTRKM